jgi:hypothetical protein
VCRRLDVQGYEHQTLADLLRPVLAEDERAALAVDLSDIRLAVCSYAAPPRDREAEPVHIEAA